MGFIRQTGRRKAAGGATHVVDSLIQRDCRGAVHSPALQRTIFVPGAGSHIVVPGSIGNGKGWIRAVHQPEFLAGIAGALGIPHSPPAKRHSSQVGIFTIPGSRGKVIALGGIPYDTI